MEKHWTYNLLYACRFELCTNKRKSLLVNAETLSSLIFFPLTLCLFIHFIFTLFTVDLKLLIYTQKIFV